MDIGENFTSADLDISFFECDWICDPEIMDYVYGDGKQSSGKRPPEAIVGTTDDRFFLLGKVIAECGF